MGLGEAQFSLLPLLSSGGLPRRASSCPVWLRGKGDLPKHPQQGDQGCLALEPCGTLASISSAYLKNTIWVSSGVLETMLEIEELQEASDCLRAVSDSAPWPLSQGF